MKIYVATKWENRQRARIVMADLKDLGHTITWDWTNDAGDGVMNQRKQAINDYNGVIDADAVVLILENDYPYEGTLVELGIALGAGKPVFILGEAPVTKRCVFIQHPNVFRGLSGLVGVR